MMNGEGAEVVRVTKVLSGFGAGSFLFHGVFLYEAWLQLLVVMGVDKNWE